MLRRRLIFLSSAVAAIAIVASERDGGAQQGLSAGFAGTIASTVPAVRLVVANEGNEVRYRIREQLVSLDLPNDAIGKTDSVSGELALNADGTLASEGSRFVVNVGGLTSDQSRRDNYVRTRILETSQHPTVTFEPTTLRGMSGPLPTSGAREFDLIGNLTIRGTAKPTTWRTSARFSGDTVTGTTRTAFTFADFGLMQPRVPIVLSVADTIRLEYDFKFVVKK